MTDSSDYESVQVFIGVEVEQRGLAYPLYPVLTSMPGVGVRTAGRLLTEVACLAFDSAEHLAAYAGLAPVTWRSGSSRRGNKTLKRALFLSAFAALREPISKAYYTRKINQGKRHNQALIFLARRRCAVLFAMMRLYPAGIINMLDNLIGPPDLQPAKLAWFLYAYNRAFLRFHFFWKKKLGCYTIN